MIQKLRKRQGGFTLIELLIVVAIIGIIAALLIPNFLDALQKAKQKRTVADLRNIGTAQMSWLTDQEAAGAAGTSTYTFPASSVDAAHWRTLLTTRYIQLIPDVDGWKNTIQFDHHAAATGDQSKFANTSLGADGAGDHNSGNIEPSAFDPTDYDQDIVWSDGFFVRWPQKIQ